jgi:hypothetical protein
MTRFFATAAVFAIAAALSPFIFLCLCALALWRCFR